MAANNKNDADASLKRALSSGSVTGKPRKKKKAASAASSSTITSGDIQFNQIKEADSMSTASSPQSQSSSDIMKIVNKLPAYRDTQEWQQLLNNLMRACHDEREEALAEVLAREKKLQQLLASKTAAADAELPDRDAVNAHLRAMKEYVDTTNEQRRRIAVERDEARANSERLAYQCGKYKMTLELMRLELNHNGIRSNLLDDQLLQFDSNRVTKPIASLSSSSNRSSVAKPTISPLASSQFLAPVPESEDNQQQQDSIVTAALTPTCPEEENSAEATYIPLKPLRRCTLCSRKFGASRYETLDHFKSFHPLLNVFFASYLKNFWPSRIRHFAIDERTVNDRMPSAMVRRIENRLKLAMQKEQGGYTYRELMAKVQNVFKDWMSGKADPDDTPLAVVDPVDHAVAEKAYQAEKKARIKMFEASQNDAEPTLSAQANAKQTARVILKAQKKKPAKRIKEDVVDSKVHVGSYNLRQVPRSDSSKFFVDESNESEEEYEENYVSIENSSPNSA